MSRGRAPGAMRERLFFHPMPKEIRVHATDRSGPLHDRRQRELFLPPVFEMPPSPSYPVFVSVRRRLARKRQQTVQTNEVISVLNEVRPAWEQVGHTHGQRLARNSLFEQVQAAPHLPELFVRRREAARELLATYQPSYTHRAARCKVRPYDRALASIPAVGSLAPEVVDAIDLAGREVIEGFQHTMMLTLGGRGRVVESEPPLRPYMDEVLRRDKEAYYQFVTDLRERNMLGWWTTEPDDIITPNKNNRQRLVWDCRVPNRRFKAPPPMAMGSGAAWANLEIENNNDDVMYIAQSDVKDFFYALTLWPGLATYFSLPPMPSDLRVKLGGALPAGQAVPASGWVWPHLRVAPIGWSWAFWVAQRVRQHIALSSSGLGVGRLLLDHAPAPLLAGGVPVILPCCDNLNVAGLDKDKVQLVTW